MLRRAVLTTRSVAATCCGQRRRDEEETSEGQHSSTDGENSLKVWSLPFLSSMAEGEKPKSA
ncbi:hypothetical protein N7492_001752 [Penicillium capsulatum]|uniref:Uncharacterized protein n=1 Tax=Penicillium capsulatum TaxID=69766 RepID=A0A9W9LZQ9_9EURO|nr:hypothetical protein N7492_001752 [Penicillium capsulatum]